MSTPTARIAIARLFENGDDFTTDIARVFPRPDQMVALMNHRNRPLLYRGRFHFLDRKYVLRPEGQGHVILLREVRSGRVQILGEDGRPGKPIDLDALPGQLFRTSKRSGRILLCQPGMSGHIHLHSGYVLGFLCAA